MYSAGFQVYVNGELLSDDHYYLDQINARIRISSPISADSITLIYERLPINLSDGFKHKSSSIILSDTVTAYKDFIYTISSSPKNDDLFGASKLNKQGSISRGISVGNAQNLSLQSTLNLQLGGQIAPNLFMQGSISDDNVPFQPDGNTQKLQEFDQVYLKVYNSDFAVIGGDFWLKKPTGHFLNYNKRTQGVSLESYHPMSVIGAEGKASHKISGAFSKGKFARNVVQGVEGNQGPYRLKGAENETYIIVLAGTEKVYIDGKLLTRGQEFDYTIDYNTAEVTFTANNLITKDIRLIIEFQYSDLNYARSLIAYNGEFTGEKYTSWINIYSEQDAKNQTIQQTLTADKKQILSEVGDSLYLAFSNSIDSIGYFENRILYALIDSLGYDSVLVFSVNPDSAIYQARFAQVDFGQGDYIFDRYTANGRVYKWVAPIAGVSQGNYAPIQLLIAPQKKQMFVFGTEYKFTDKISTFAEVAVSNHDDNTFSKKDKSDDRGIAVKWRLNALHHLNDTKTWRLKSTANFEFSQANFSPIQWYRDVEFDRDWNVRNTPFTGDQYLSGVTLNLIGKESINITYDFQNFIWGDDYLGLKNSLKLRYQKNGWSFENDVSHLASDGIENSSFIRHQTAFSKNFKKIKLGFEDLQEINKKQLAGTDIMALNSYRFYDWKTYISTSDSSINKFEIYYRERYDWLSDSLRLLKSAKAENIGFEAGFVKNPNNILRLNVNYRRLSIIDSTLFDAKPENTILNRLEHVLKLWKGAVTTTSFYELGSGLELKKEFIFLEVNPGQGTHTWIDYNNDGIKDLGEFEIAVFADQGKYIRVFVPTNEYVRTYSNQFSTNLFLRPETIWRGEKGLKKTLSYFSNQTIYKVNRKTNFENQFQLINPFVYEIADTNLVSISTTFRNTFFINRSSAVFGVNYSYQENASKILLSNGFDSRLNTFHEIVGRWNINKFYNLKLTGNLGRKKTISDYASNRNYFIEYYDIEPVFSYQPNSAFRVALSTKITEKENNSELKEKATIRDVGIDFRYSQAQKGSFNARINYILIAYNGPLNSSLAFEMLEGLKTGNNFTWGMTYQRKVAKNLQLNLNYNGRKSEENKPIHSGGIELRAFF